VSSAAVLVPAGEPPDQVDQVDGPNGDGRRGGAAVVRWLGTASGLRDAVLFGAVYLAYSLSRFASISSRAAAVAHARTIASLERDLHVGIEAQVQSVFGHAPFPQMFNYVYLAAQVFVIPLVLFVLYVRGPQRVYRTLRNTVLCAWILALPVYALYPTAPPRLAGLGIIDTVSRDSVIPLNSRLTTSLFNPYASVPSMHAGLAVAISVALVVAWRTPWTRLLGALWGPLMCLVVVATGNHFVFDVVVGLLCTAAGFGVSVVLQRAYASGRSSCRARRQARWRREGRGTLGGPPRAEPVRRLELPVARPPHGTV
jgi:hypothetical protein